MPNPPTRIEKLEQVLNAHILDDRQCGCGWINGGEDSQHAFWSEHVVAAVVEALGFREEFAVSSGGRRNFEPFPTREDAERGLSYAMSNNQRWEASGKELPVWARDPHIESRLISLWERDRA